MRKHRVLRTATLCSLALFCVAALAAQTSTVGNRSGAPLDPDEFGTTKYTVLTIGAASFTSDTSYTTLSNLFRTFPLVSPGHYFAAVNVPSGVIIDFIGLESASSGTGELSAALSLIDRDGVAHPVGSVSNTPHSPTPDSDYNPTALGFQLIRNVHNMLVFDVSQLAGTGPHFGWVEVWYRRTLGSPPPTPSFGDVPEDHLYFRAIEALAEAGITSGCGSGNFCPSQPVTRGEMAKFLANALGLQWSF